MRHRETIDLFLLLILFIVEPIDIVENQQSNYRQGLQRIFREKIT